MKVTYDTENLDLDLTPGESLLSACIKNKVPISHACEGMASCGTCRVIVTEGLENFPERNILEQEMSDDRNFRKEERLACQTTLNSDFSFKLPNE